MNIVTPIPTTIVFNTANVNTESARRDNQLRETVPATTQSDGSAAETGLGSESDRVKTPGQQQVLTYERPQAQPQQAADGQNKAEQNAANQDNAEDPSAGKQDAEDKQQEQAKEQQELQELKQRDQEVRAHEQAHASVGGQYASSPQYEYEKGSDGRQYAVGGEVSIDISKESNPEETLRKLQRVQAAALAPAEPSPQDLRVASEARQGAQEARAEIADDRREQFVQANASVFPDLVKGENKNGFGSELDDIVKGSGDIGSPFRSLSEDPVAEAVGLESDAGEFRQALASRDSVILKRVSVIEGFYQQVSEPRTANLKQSA